MWALALWIRQKFFCQNFPDAHSSKFSLIKILHHTVTHKICGSKCPEGTGVTSGTSGMGR